MADHMPSLPERRVGSIHPQEDCRCMHLMDLTVKQAMASSEYAPYFQEGRLAQFGELYQTEKSTTRGGTPVIKIHERFAHIYCNPTARAAMARQEDEQSNLVDYSKDKSVIVLDCGASTTVTGSLLNCTDVEVKNTIIETAKDGEGMTAAHSEVIHARKHTL